MAMIYGNISNCNVVDKGTRSEYQVRLGYEILKENVETNTREVKLQLEVRTINANYTTFGYDQTSTVDGVQLEPATFSVRNVNQWIIFGARTITIKGAFNGIKTGSFITNANATWQLKSGSASVNISLENLHTPAEITSIEIEEKNTLLENATQIVQNLSIKNFTFETITYDDATILSYQVYHNGVLIGSSTTNGMTIDFGNVSSLATFEMNGKLYCTLKFLVIDSFNTSSFVEIQYEVIQYTKPSLVKTSSSIKRNGQLTGKVKLNLVGSFYNDKVNDIPNTIKLEFAYWKKGEEESTTYYEIPFEPTNNNINLYSWAVEKEGIEITDVDKDFAYIFKIRATDYFNKISDIDLLCPVGEYVWAEFKNRVDFKDITIQNVKVIESDDNTSGSYIKFADGNMICRGRVVVPRNVGGGQTIDVVLPAEFIDNDYDVSLSVLVVGGYWSWLRYAVLERTETSMTVQSWNDTTNTIEETTLSYTAIGKWK